MKATWKKSYGPKPYDEPIVPVQLSPPTPMPELSEILRLMPLYQPTVPRVNLVLMDNEIRR